MAQVLLGANGLGKAFGHPVYHPIYEAAAEVGLPVAIHAGADATVSGLSHPTAGGPPATFSEYYVLASQSLCTHAASLITQGVLDKYPSLKVLLVGGGILWLPHVLWRLDGNYKAKRKEVPWLHRLPSEIFRQHFRVATYPLEKEPNTQALQRLLASYPEYSEVLCYASGYPTVDADSPQYLSERLPRSFLPTVFDLNARDVVGVSSSDVLPATNAR
jgi:predicted TIM-barrel fold metal-dependent hydrolase